MQVIDPIARAVRSLIQKRGGPVSMVVEKKGVYNVATSSVEAVRKLYTPQAIVLDAKEALSPASLIRAGDKQLFILPDDSIPRPTTVETEFKIQGEIYKVYLVRELNPNGLKAIYYEVYVRR